MASFLDILNEVVSGIILSDEPITGLGSVYFLLIFFLLFAVVFTATAYVPMFAKKEEYKNLRMVISFSMAFLTSITFYSTLVGQLQFFGLVAAISLGISLTLLGIIPKNHRDKAGTYVTFISIICGVIISVILLDLTSYFTPIIELITNQWTGLVETGNIWWFLIITVAVIAIISSVSKEVMNNKGAGGP